MFSRINKDPSPLKAATSPISAPPVEETRSDLGNSNDTGDDFSNDNSSDTSSLCSYSTNFSLCSDDSPALPELQIHTLGFAIGQFNTLEPQEMHFFLL